MAYCYYYNKNYWGVGGGGGGGQNGCFNRCNFIGNIF